MADLLPCPFCGGDAEMLNGGPGNYFVRCTTCKATSDDRCEEGAIAAWNHRVGGHTLDGAPAEPMKREAD